MARFVLVHGGFSDAWIWLPLMDRLKAAGHLVEAFDLPGMGDDRTSASEVSLDSYEAACVSESRPHDTPTLAAPLLPAGLERSGRCPQFIDGPNFIQTSRPIAREL
jgi:pimeloyl-ACP methyl ester carboxylesterase